MSVSSSTVLQSARGIYREHTLRAFDGKHPGVILFSHLGEFNHTKIDQLLKFAETAVLLEGSKRKVMKRICSVLIECLQNIAHHAARDQSGQQQAFAMLSKHQGFYRLVTGNLILQQDANLIDYRLGELNKLDQSEVRKLYIETLCNENFSFKGGAGLGFLTIAKKTKNKIDYHIAPLDDHFAYLAMGIDIPDAE